MSGIFPYSTCLKFNQCGKSLAVCAVVKCVAVLIIKMIESVLMCEYTQALVYSN